MKIIKIMDVVSFGKEPKFHNGTAYYVVGCVERHIQRLSGLHKQRLSFFLYFLCTLEIYSYFLYLASEKFEIEDGYI